MRRPTPVPTIAAVAMFALLVALGFWQLDRAGQKRELRAAFEAALDSAPMRVVSAVGLDALPRYQPVVFEAAYLPGRQALLEAQVHAGRAGYRVWTPAEFVDDTRVLVDRGWVPADGDRTVIPDIEVGDDQRTVRGFVAPLPRPGIRLGPADLGDPVWPRRLTWPDAEALDRVWGPGLPAAIVLLHPDEADGFVRDWDPAVFPPERHVAYAVQWFALAAALVVIVIVVLRKKGRSDGRERTS